MLAPAGKGRLGTRRPGRLNKEASSQILPIPSGQQGHSNQTQSIGSSSEDEQQNSAPTIDGLVAALGDDGQNTILPLLAQGELVKAFAELYEDDELNWWCRDAAKEIEAQNAAKEAAQPQKRRRSGLFQQQGPVPSGFLTMQPSLVIPGQEQHTEQPPEIVAALQAILFACFPSNFRVRNLCQKLKSTGKLSSWQRTNLPQHKIKFVRLAHLTSLLLLCKCGTFFL